MERSAVRRSRRSSTRLSGNQLQKLAARAKAAHLAAERLAESAFDKRLEAGEALLAAKASLDHGKWGNWVETRCAIQRRQAERYMQLAKLMKKAAPDASARTHLNELGLQEAIVYLQSLERAEDGRNTGVNASSKRPRRTGRRPGPSDTSEADNETDAGVPWVPRVHSPDHDGLDHDGADHGILDHESSDHGVIDDDGRGHDEAGDEAEDLTEPRAAYGALRVAEAEIRSAYEALERLVRNTSLEELGQGLADLQAPGPNRAAESASTTLLLELRNECARLEAAMTSAQAVLAHIKATCGLARTNT